MLFIYSRLVPKEEVSVTKSESKEQEAADGKLSGDNCRRHVQPGECWGVKCVESKDVSFQKHRYSIVTAVVDERWTLYVH